jgi:hypothetical protein
MFSRTKNIRLFLAHPGNFTDQRIAELYAHCEDEKLVFMSCCCLSGSATANHPLQSTRWDFAGQAHLYAAKKLPFAQAAEAEFYELGGISFLGWLIAPDGSEECDIRRRRRLLPLLRAELDRRMRERRIEGELWFIRKVLKMEPAALEKERTPQKV